MEKPPGLNIVITGDGGIGKTTFLASYIKRELPGDYIPTVYDVTEVNVKVDGSDVPVSFWDTAGGDDYSRIRWLSYRKAHITIIAYSVNNMYSLPSIKDYWLPGVLQQTKVPFVFIGLKNDLRDNPENRLSHEISQPMVSYAEAEDLALQCGAVGHFEVSAFKVGSFDDVIVQLVKLALEFADPPTEPLKPEAPVPRKGPSLLDSLEILVNNEKIHDVVIRSKDGEVYAHKFMLCSASEKMQKLIENHVTIPHVFESSSSKDDVITIELHESITKEEFLEFLTFLYHAKAKESPSKQFIQIAQACDIDYTVDRREILQKNITKNLDKYVDFKIVGNDGLAIPVVKALLYCRCERFAKELTEEKQDQIVESELSAHQIESILTYINRGSIKKGEEEALLDLALKWDWTYLIDACQFEVAAHVISVKNVIDWLIRTDKYPQLKSLQEYCLWFGQTHHSQIKDKKNYKDLPTQFYPKLSEFEFRKRFFDKVNERADHGKPKDRCLIQ